jgi:hypothetical protein
VASDDQTIRRLTKNENQNDNIAHAITCDAELVVMIRLMDCCSLKRRRVSIVVVEDLVENWYWERSQTVAAARTFLLQ